MPVSTGVIFDRVRFDACIDRFTSPPGDDMRGIESEDTEIQWVMSILNERRRILRTHVNSMASIARLPNEVMIAIFGFCGPSVETTTKGSNSLDPTSLWYTHVCSAWRDLAISTSRIWAVPLFDWPKAATEMIRRARSAPLTIVCHNPRQNSQVPLRMAFARGNLQSVDVQVKSSLMEALLKSTQPSQLAPLTWMRLHVLADRHSEESMNVPEAIEDMASHAPDLRFLSLTGVVPPRFSSDLASITTFEFFLGHLHSSVWPVRQIAELLKHMPNLQSLSLKLFGSADEFRTVRVPTLDSAGDGQIVQLYRLEKMKIKAKIGTLIPLFAALGFRPSARVELDVASACSRGSLKEFCERLSNHVSFTDEQDPMRVLAYGIETDDHTAALSFKPTAGDSATFTFRVPTNNHTGGLIIPLVQTIASDNATAFMHIQRISIENLQHDESLAWKDFMDLINSMPSLEELEFSRRGALRLFVNCLSTLLGVGQKLQAFSQISAIVLKNADFDTVGPVQIKGREGLYECPVTELIEIYLRRRAEQKNKLQMLLVHNCDPDDEMEPDEAINMWKVHAGYVQFF